MAIFGGLFNKKGRAHPEIEKALDNNELFRYQNTPDGYENSARGGLHFTMGQPNPTYLNSEDDVGGSYLIKRYINAAPNEIATVNQPSAVSSAYFQENVKNYSRFQKNLPWDKYEKRDRNALRYLRAHGVEHAEASQYVEGLRSAPPGLYNLSIKERIGVQMAKRAGFKAIRGVASEDDPYPEYLTLSSDAVSHVPMADARINAIDGFTKKGISAEIRKAIADIHSPVSAKNIREQNKVLDYLSGLNARSKAARAIPQDVNDPRFRIKSMAEQLYKKYQPLMDIIREEGGYVYAPAEFNPRYRTIKNLKGQYTGDIIVAHSQEMDPFNVIVAEQRKISSRILRRSFPTEDSNFSIIMDKAKAAYADDFGGDKKKAAEGILNMLRSSEHGGILDRLVKTPKGFYRAASKMLGLRPMATYQGIIDNKVSKDLGQEVSGMIKHNPDLFTSFTSRPILREPPLALPPGKAASTYAFDEALRYSKGNPWKAVGIGGAIIAGIGLTNRIMSSHMSHKMANQSKRKEKENKHPYRSMRSVQSSGIFG